MATLVSTQAIIIDRLRQANRAIAIATIAIRSDGPRRLVDHALVHGATDTRPVRGRLSRSMPCRPSEATVLKSPMRSAARIAVPPLGPCPIQTAKNTPPTPANRPR